MHRIYFEKRCIIICEPGDQALADPNAVEFHLGERIDVHTLVLMFESSKELSRIYIPAADTDKPQQAQSRARERTVPWRKGKIWVSCLSATAIPTITICPSW